MGEINMNNPRYGGFWIRVVAVILDSIIFGIPSFMLQLGILFVTKMPSLTYLINLALVVIYVYMEGMIGGTPGKLILGLRIVNEKGDFIGIPKAILRYIGKILAGIILGIGYLMVVFSEKKQGLHDRIANTYVVYK